MPESPPPVEMTPAGIQLERAIREHIENDFSFDGPASWFEILKNEEDKSGERMAVQAVRTGLISPFQEADALISTLPPHLQHLHPTALRLKYNMLLRNPQYSDFLKFAQENTPKKVGVTSPTEEEVFMNLGQYANVSDIHHLIKSYLVTKAILRPDEVNTAIDRMKGLYSFFFSDQALSFIRAAQAIDEKAHETSHYRLGHATEPAYQDPLLLAPQMLHATTENQDAMVSLVLTVGGKKVTLIGVADGISGSGLQSDGTRHSQIASNAAVRLLAYYVQQMKEPTPQELENAFAQVNADVWTENEAAKEKYAHVDEKSEVTTYSPPPFTTLSAMLLLEDQVIVGSVGDSYLSVQRAGSSRQLVEPDKLGPHAPIVRFIGHHPANFTLNHDNFRTIFTGGDDTLQHGDIFRAHTDGTSLRVIVATTTLAILYKLANMQLPTDLALELQRQETRQYSGTPEQERRTPPGELWDDATVVLAERI